jgi:hypothetical protein
MSTQLAISCPHCAATLKLKNNTFVGKKVPCPKCKKPFVVEQPPEDEFLAGDSEDYGDMANEESEHEEEVEAPRAKANAKGGKSKKKKSKSGGGFGPIAMIGGGVVLGLGLLGGLAYFAMTLFSGGTTNSWVKWLPENTDIAVQIRVADSLNAPFFKPITDHPTLSKLINQPPTLPMGGSTTAITYFQSLGIQAKDVDTLTFGATDGMAMAKANDQGPPRGPQQFVAVIRLKVPLEEAKLAQAPATVLTKEDYNGKSLYAIVGATSPKVSVHSVDATTILLGSDAELKAAIDGNGSAPAASRYAFADDKANFLFVAAPQDPEQLKSIGLSTFKTLKSGSKEQTTDVKGIYGNSYSITLNQDLVVNTRMSLDPGMAKNTADQFKLDVETFRTQFKASMTQMKSPNPFVSQAMIDKLVGHVDTMFASAQSSESGSTANLTMTLSGQIVADTLQMAEPFMPMLEQMAQQAQMAANSTAVEKPKIGDKAVDVLAYPGMVISAGENSKAKANALADKHNADIEAAMQEGAPAAAPPAAEGEAVPGNAVGEKAALMAKPEGDADAAEPQPQKKKKKGDDDEEMTAPAPADDGEMAKPDSEEGTKGGATKPGRKLSKKEQKLLEEQQEQGNSGGAPPPALMPDEETEEAADDGEDKPASKSAPKSAPIMKFGRGDEDEQMTAPAPADDGEMAKPAPETGTKGKAAKPGRKLSKKEQKLLEEQQEQGNSGGAPPPAPMPDDEAEEAADDGEDKPSSKSAPKSAPIMKFGRGDEDEEMTAPAPADDGEMAKPASKSASKSAPLMKSDNGKDDDDEEADDSEDVVQPKSAQKSRSRRRTANDKSDD